MTYNQDRNSRDRDRDFNVLGNNKEILEPCHKNDKEWILDNQGIDLTNCSLPSGAVVPDGIGKSLWIAHEGFLLRRPDMSYLKHFKGYELIFHDALRPIKQADQLYLNNNVGRYLRMSSLPSGTAIPPAPDEHLWISRGEFMKLVSSEVARKTSR